MNIDEIMTKRVVTVEMDDSLQVVKEIFGNTGFHHVLVVRGKKLVGVLSDRDLLKSMSPYIDTPSELTRDTVTLSRKVHQIMSRKPVTLTVNSTVVDAIHIFNREPISCIPIVDDEDIPVGIISWRDIFQSWAKAA